MTLCIPAPHSLCLWRTDANTVMSDCHTDLTIEHKGEGKRSSKRKKNCLQIDLLVLDCCNDWMECWNPHWTFEFGAQFSSFPVSHKVTGHLRLSKDQCVTQDTQDVSLLLTPPPRLIWILHHMILKPDCATWLQRQKKKNQLLQETMSSGRRSAAPCGHTASQICSQRQMVFF